MVTLIASVAGPVTRSVAPGKEESGQQSFPQPDVDRRVDQVRRKVSATINQNSHSPIPSRVGSFFEQLPMYVGSPLCEEHLKEISPQEKFGVGEYIGVRSLHDKSWILACITRSAGENRYEYYSKDLCCAEVAGVEHIRKIRTRYLRVILDFLIRKRALSLRCVPTSRDQEEVAYPPLGEQVRPENRQVCTVEERFEIGELVAVLSTGGEWFYSRVLDNVENGIQYIKITKSGNFGQEGTIFLDRVAKVRAYPRPIGSIHTHPVSLAREEIQRTPGGKTGLEDLSPSSFVNEFIQRPLTSIAPLPGWFMAPAYGYEATSSVIEADMSRVCQLMEATTICFQERLKIYNREVVGLFQESILPSGTKIYVCGDLHGNLHSLISILRFLQREYFLNERFVCAPDFAMIFLGDYLDRGRNDLQVLVLLLSLRLLNPHSVFLLRGNHETVYPRYHEDFHNPVLAQFIARNEDLCSRCFQTFPMALCVSSQEQYFLDPTRRQQQYVHFSHGLFSLSVDPSSMVQGKNSLSPILQRATFAPSWTSQEKTRKFATEILGCLFEHVQEANNPLGYLWSDINQQRALEHDGLRFPFSHEEIDLVRKASETAQKKICVFIRAHQHQFNEHAVIRRAGKQQGGQKVVAITLPMNTYSCSSRKGVQGLLVTVAARVRDWRKVPCTVSWDKDSDTFDIVRESLEEKMYNLMNTSALN